MAQQVRASDGHDRAALHPAGVRGQRPRTLHRVTLQEGGGRVQAEGPREQVSGGLSGTQWGGSKEGSLGLRGSAADVE